MDNTIELIVTCLLPFGIMSIVACLVSTLYQKFKNSTILFMVNFVLQEYDVFYNKFKFWIADIILLNA